MPTGIYAGALPFVTATFPLGVASGTAASITWPGSTSGAPSVSVRGDPTALVGGTIPLACRRPRARAESQGRRPRALSGGLEAEPNDELGVAQTLAIPSTVNGRSGPARRGRIVPPRRHDVFRFTARKGQALVFEVTAQQLGSPLDSIIEVLDADGRPVPRALIRCARANRNRAQRSRLEPPQHPARGLERDRHQRLPDGG